MRYSVCVFVAANLLPVCKNIYDLVDKNEIYCLVERKSGREDEKKGEGEEKYRL